jgi:3-oxoacyl-[acyl-carrier-protein] synthase III
MKASIKSIEYFLPRQTETRVELERDNPDWRMDDIEAKTGIKTRHIAAQDETAVDLGVAACEMMFANGISRDEVDFLILITQSPDYVLPTSACIVQDRVGLKKACMAFDVNLGCSGFIYGLAIGGSFIESGLAKNGLIVCSETYSKYIDKTDRTCRPIFSDGASAVLLSGDDDSLLGPFELGTDGAGFKDLMVPRSESRLSDTSSEGSRLTMNGAKVFMFTMGTVPKCVQALLNKSEKTVDDIDLFVFHQASKLVIDNVIRHLDLPPEKVFVNYERIGNTVSASIPIALKDAENEGCLKDGNQVMLVGFGVGLSWGGCLIKWRATS